MVIDKDLQKIFPDNTRYWECSWLIDLYSADNRLHKRILFAVLLVSGLFALGLLVFDYIISQKIQISLIFYASIQLILALLILKIRYDELIKNLFILFLFASGVVNCFLPLYRLYYLVPMLALLPVVLMLKGLNRGLIISALNLVVYICIFLLGNTDTVFFSGIEISRSDFFISLTVYIFLLSLLFLNEYIRLRERFALYKARIFDDATGLPKRYLIDHVVSPHNFVYLAIVSIRNLTHIGIIMGYDFLNKVTTEMADRLKSATANQDCSVYRLTRGEFGIVFEDEDSSFLQKHAEKKVADIYGQLSNIKITNGNLFIYVEIDIGSAVGTADQISHILSKADQIKTDSRDQKSLKGQFLLETDIKRRFVNDQRKHNVLLNNLRNNTVEVHYQPVTNLKTGETFFYEALLRLRDQKNELVSIYSYLEIAKKTGLYPKLTEILLATVFEKIRKGFKKAFSVNLSLNDIENTKFMKIINENEAFLKENSDKIIFEITESDISSGLDAMRVFLKFAKKVNLQIAIDDFGSGYSNFTRFSEFQPFLCKIDGKFFQKAFSEDFSSRILQGIIALCKSLKVQTVAEFIETEDHKKYARNCEVDFGQGFLFRRPGPDPE